MCNHWATDLLDEPRNYQQCLRNENSANVAVYGLPKQMPDWCTCADCCKAVSKAGICKPVPQLDVRSVLASGFFRWITFYWFEMEMGTLWLGKCFHDILWMLLLLWNSRCINKSMHLTFLTMLTPIREEFFLMVMASKSPTLRGFNELVCILK